MIRTLSASLFVWVATISVAGAEDLQSRINPLAQPLIDDGLVVGMVVGVARNGEIQYFAFGETEKGRGNRPNPKTVYEIGSISKAITGSILADMVQNGEVRLDDPVQKYLPDSVAMPVADDRPITLEHLSTHTSGLPRLADNFKPADHDDPYADFTVDSLHSFIKEHKFRRPPGEYEYSNLGAGMLGFLLAKHEGKSYEELLADHITKPLGMNDTTVVLRSDQQQRLAVPYNAALKRDRNWAFPTLAGAGGIRSTAADMMRYLEANLADDDKPLTRSLKLAHEKRADIGDGGAIGLGWHIARDGKTRWHNGMTGGYAAWASIVAEKKVAVVVLSNTATMKITELGELITRVACGEKVDPPKTRKTVAVEPALLESYVGSYYILPWFSLTVTREGDQLLVQASGQDKYPVFAESPTEFYYKVVDAQITFAKNDAGKIDKLILHQNGRDLKAFKLK